MKGFFILSAITLLASCQKTNPVTHTSPPQMMEIAAKNLIPGGPISSGRFKLTFIPLLPAASALPKRDTIPIGSALLQFTIGNITYQFNDSITAKEYVQYGLKHIFIEVQKEPSTYQINIIGDSTQISPGTYPYNIIPCCGGTGNTFAPNSAMFLQWQYDYGIADQDFSLQILSYQDGYLDGTFHSSRVSNGTINHLKIIKQ